MAKPPSKRRGITLNPRADRAAALDLLRVPPVPPVSATHDAAGGAPESGEGGLDAVPERTRELLAQMRHMAEDADRRWHRQAEESQRRLQEIEQQRDQIALQLRELQAVQGRRRTSRRLGVLMALLTVAGGAAFGFHSWPRLSELAGQWSRLSTEAAQIDPQLQALSAQLAALTAETGQVGTAVAALRNDVASVRSDLGPLRQVVNRLPQNKGTADASGAGLRRAAHTLPRNATNVRNPYRAMRPPMRW